MALRNFEDTEKARGTRGNDSDSVKYLRHQNSGRGENSGFSSKKPSTVICHKCGEAGHISPRCPNNNNNKKSKKKSCSMCPHLSNHTDKTCRKQQNVGGAQNDGGRNLAAKATDQEHSFVFVMRDLEEKVADFENKLEFELKSDSDVVQKILEVENVVEEVFEEKTVHLATGNDVANATADVDSSEKFLVDSGATSPIVYDDSLFVSTDPSFQPHKHSITLADGSVTTGMALKKGTIKFSLKNVEGKIVVFWKLFTNPVIPAKYLFCEIRSGEEIICIFQC